MSVEVGNIGSGFAVCGEFFNLDEFPGYRIELLAGGQVIVEDNNSLAGVIPDRESRTANLSFTVGETHRLLGQNLGIRLVNLNQIPAGFDADTSPYLEVDFDDVQLMFGLLGDTDGDGLVDIDDLNNVRNNFGATGPDDGTLDGDAVSFDGMVNIDDLNGVRNNFGAGAFGLAPVPEPAGLALAALGAGLCLLSKRPSMCYTAWPRYGER